MPMFLQTCCAAIGLLMGTVAASAAPRLEVPRSGLHPDELGVLVREGDPVSAAIAEHYRQARGIPAENVVRVSLPAKGDRVDASTFAAVRERVDAQLPARVQATVLTWLQPSKVVGGCAMSITSAFALGYDDRRCSLGDRGGGLDSPYYDSDTTRPWDTLRLRPSMMLGAATLDEARVLVDRGRRADGTAPPGDAYLVRTTDAVRSLRWPDFQAAASAPGGLHVELLDRGTGPASANALTGRKGVMFYFTGLAQTPSLDANSYRPGAVGDSLTSFGGQIAGSEQTSALEWLRAGLTASYGTVEEPYAHEEKFPRVSVLLDHYQRGATLIEAYWKSVRQPGQGLFVGEPLARPFADKPRWAVAGPGRTELTTRALRTGRRYPVLAQRDEGGSWAPVGTLTGKGLAAPPYPVALPSGARALRLAAQPCPVGVRLAAAVRGDPTPLPTGRPRRLVYQVELRLLPEPEGCDAAEPLRVDLVVPALGDGVRVRASEALEVLPGQSTLGRVEVTLPAALARSLPVQMGWKGAGASQGGQALAGWRIALADPPSKPLRIVEPGPNWNLAAARGADGLRLPVAADVDPASGIARVRFQLREALGVRLPIAEVVASGPSPEAELHAPWLPAGTYRLVARGEDAAGVAVATVSWLVQVPLGAR